MKRNRDDVCLMQGGRFGWKAKAEAQAAEVSSSPPLLSEAVPFMFHGKIVQHKNVLIQICEKSDWNGMLDKITDLGFYPHLILILTSNILLEKINE